MGGLKLERRVEDALAAAGEVTQHARGLEQAPPQRERTAGSVAAACDSLRSLAAYGRTINPDFSVPLPSSGTPAEQLSLEARFRTSGRGHDRPQRFLRNFSEARAHSQEEERGVLDALRRIRPHIYGPGVALSKPPYAEGREAPPGSAERLSAGVAGWFGADVLGTALSARFARSPPVVTSESFRFFSFLAYLEGTPMYAGAMYHTGTNHLSINVDTFMDEDMTEGDKRNVLAHEMFHYASWLGGGSNIRYRDAQGGPVFTEAMWLNEGMTELHAQQLVRSHGQRTSRVAYANETTVAFYLQQLAGTDIVRAAYLSGDFTEVRRRVDEVLGGGTFEALLATGGGAGALLFLRERAEQKMPARLAAWDNDALIRLAGAAAEAAGMGRQPPGREAGAVESVR
ncbi:MAG: hypothetical protein AB1529_06585 [Candidatus Micrarchaeota archaeon]